MALNSSIEWTDATWNPVRGCTKVSPGCAHCYAETFAERFRGVKNHPFEQGFDLRLVPKKLDAPLLWRKPRRIFVNSMSDLFHEAISEDYIAEVAGITSGKAENSTPAIRACFSSVSFHRATIGGFGTFRPLRHALGNCGR
jgi:protein gp37